MEVTIDMRELNSNQFIKKHYELRNDSMTKDIDSYKSPFPLAMLSFFLQSHNVNQMQAQMASRNQAMSQFINSIKRKLPDRIDIFNKKSETDFVAMMGSDFKRIIKEELNALRCFLPHEIAIKTVNDQFNYIEEDASEFGNISFDNLKYLIRQCFFQDWVPLMERVYKTMVQEGEGKKAPVDQHII
jgi:hypothetical protein